MTAMERSAANPAQEPTRSTDRNRLRRGTLSDLAARLEGLRQSTRDVVVDSRALAMNGAAEIEVPSVGVRPLTGYAHGQLAEKTGVPFRYYELMRAKKPELLARNVNAWLGDQPDRRLVRLADGSVRAILSDRYRTLDNYDLALTVADRAIEHEAEVIECSLSDTHMAVKLTVPRYREAVLRGDEVVPGILVTNSEVGAAAFRVEAFVWRLVCRNGLVSASAFRQVHVGAKLELGEVAWRDDTRQAEDSATWRKVRDIIDATFSGEGKFRELVSRMRATTEIPIAKPLEVTDAVAKNLSLSEDRKTALLRYFSREGDTVYGLVNGITRLAQDLPDHAEQIELERFAGELIANPDSALALAA